MIYDLKIILFTDADCTAGHNYSPQRHRGHREDKEFVEHL